MFKNQPKGLYVLALANTGERFGYYTVMAVLVLFLQAKFGLTEAQTGQFYGIFLAVAYFLPLVGGVIADKWSFSKCVVLGMFIMLAGYGVLSLPTQAGATTSLIILIAGLLLVAIGTGFFKGNLQVMIGDLYNHPRYASSRDNGFNLFYMFINIGAFFAPGMASWLMNMTLDNAGLIYQSQLPELCNKFIANEAPALSADIVAAAQSVGMSVGTDVSAFAHHYIEVLSKGYGLAFAVACGSMVVSYLIYFLGRNTYKHIIDDKKKQTDCTTKVATQPQLTRAQTRSRIVALLLVFGVVIFFWMVFMQSGATLTLFADRCTSPDAYGATRIGFNVWALVAIWVLVYALFAISQSKKSKNKIIAGIIAVAAIAAIIVIYCITSNPVKGILPMDYQQFDPFYIVALTPVSIAIFSWLAKRGKEPSAPCKIGYGMIVAALAYVVMILASLSCTVNQGTVNGSVSPNWLMSTYLVLVFAELLLSPIGISFVTQVAPPKYKGAMMGCWFVATAIGNYLTSIPMNLWGKMPLPVMWAILVGLCLLAAGFIFAIMKKLEAVTAEASSAQAEAAAGLEIASDTEI